MAIACLSFLDGCMERDPAGPGMHTTYPWTTWQEKRANQPKPAPTDPNPEFRQIAEACLDLLNSSRTSDGPVQPDDPQLPWVIRALHPLSIELGSRYVIIRIEPRDGLVEYLFAPVPSSSGKWQLLGAGQKVGKKTKELCRISVN
jgi:hypothetical protein